MKKFLTLCLILFLVFAFVGSPPASKSEEDWRRMTTDFVTAYEALQVPRLQLSYLGNLENIPATAMLTKRETLFDQLKKDLKSFSRELLSPTQRLEYDLLQYQLVIHTERLDLEQEWSAHPPAEIPEGGLLQLPNGKDWYRHFLKRWIDVSATPENMFDFGMAEVRRVKAEMKTLQERSGMDSLSFQEHINSDAFYYTDVASVQAAYDQVKMELAPKLATYFPGINQIPAHYIARGTNQALARAPAFYHNNTFYYNFFDQPYNKRQIVWIYLHEAVPGHHYERSYSPTVQVTPLQSLFRVPCYAEGWAAYVEEIGNEIGAYRDIYDELGKWEWDIIRSVRVPLDVALNYYGWSDEKALDFWRQHIHGQDDVGRREIARMRRWPCQVITYKYGGQKILEWKAHFEQQAGFDLKTFHEKVLGRGPLPIAILDQLMVTS